MFTKKPLENATFRTLEALPLQGWRIDVRPLTQGGAALALGYVLQRLQR